MKKYHRIRWALIEYSVIVAVIVMIAPLVYVLSTTVGATMGSLGKTAAVVKEATRKAAAHSGSADDSEPFKEFFYSLTGGSKSSLFDSPTSSKNK